MGNKKINIYIDESGDTGIKFDEGSSEFFVVSLLFIKDEELSKIEKILKSIVDNLVIYPKELKFSDTSFKNKIIFYNMIKNVDFKANIFIYKKHIKRNFYYFIKWSLENIIIKPDTTYIITIDGIDENKFTSNDIKNIKLLFRLCKTKILFLDSKKNIFLQFSDMLAGLVHSIYKGKVDYEGSLKAIKHKIRITQIE